MQVCNTVPVTQRQYTRSKVMRARTHTQCAQKCTPACVPYPSTHVHASHSHYVHSHTMYMQAHAPFTQSQLTGYNTQTPSNLHREAHRTHTRTRMHGTCAIMPAGVTYMCAALHVGRYVHTGASRHRHRHPEATHHCAQPHMLFPQGNPSLSVPLESRLTRFPFSPSGPWGPVRPIDP